MLSNPANAAHDLGFTALPCLLSEDDVGDRVGGDFVPGVVEIAEFTPGGRTQRLHAARIEAAGRRGPVFVHQGFHFVVGDALGSSG